MDGCAMKRFVNRAGVMTAGLCLAAGTAGAQPQTRAIPQVTIPDRPDNVNVRRDPVHLIGNIYWVGHSQVGAFPAV